jgi:GTPase SAR1 family protein
MEVYKFKLIIAGEPGAGKTEIANAADACLPLRPFGVSISKKFDGSLDVNCNLTLMIWTLSEGRPKETTFYTGTDGVIIVGNLQKWDTIINMKKWADSINANIKGIPIFFIGTKYDLAEPNHIDQLKKIARSYNSPWYYINYNDKDEVKEVFNSVARKLLKLKGIDPDG